MTIKLLILTCICLIAAAAHAQEKTIRFTPHSVKDPGINNVEAVRFLVPSGWKIDGGVVWMMDHWIQASLSMRISNPNGNESITILPADTAYWQQGGVFGFQPGQRYMGSVVMQVPDNIPDIVRHIIIPGHRPQLRNARAISNEDLPKLADVVLRSNQEQGFQKVCKAGKVRLAYNEGGKEFEEDIYTVMIYTPFPQMNAMTYHLERSYCVRAEKGKLDNVTPLLNVMLTSARIGEDWLAGYMYVQQLRNQGIQQNIRDAGELSRRIAQNSEQIRQMNRQAYENQQASQDRIYRGISQSIRGTQDYQVPGENARVELPGGYSHAYYNKASNEYIVTNDPNYNPNQATNQNWDLLEKAR